MTKFETIEWSAELLVLLVLFLFGGKMVGDRLQELLVTLSRRRK